MCKWRLEVAKKVVLVPNEVGLEGQLNWIVQLNGQRADRFLISKS